MTARALPEDENGNLVRSQCRMVSSNPQALGTPLPGEEGIVMTRWTRGYEVNMRQDQRSGEFLAVLPETYEGRNGRYYLALTEADGWTELSPAYVTRSTRTVKEYPEWIKRAMDHRLGYILNIVPRVYG